MLHGDVHEIGRAVTSVRQQSQDDEEEQRMGYQHRAEMGPSQHEPGENDEGENKIVEDAAELPEAEGIGEECAKGNGQWKSWGLGRRRWHERRIRPYLFTSSTLLRKVRRSFICQAAHSQVLRGRSFEDVGLPIDVTALCSEAVRAPFLLNASISATKKSEGLSESGF